MSRPQLMLLPGWGMESSVWSPIRRKLAEHFELTFVEWRNVTSITTFEERVIEKINARPGQSYTFLGWSLGALVAIKAADLCPSQINGVILLGGTSRFTTDFGYKYGWSPRLVKRMKRMLARNKDQTLRAFHESMFSEEERKRGIDELFLQRVQGEFRGDGMLSLQLGLDYLLQQDCREHLSSLKKPLLMIHGEKDTVCPVQALKYMVEQTEQVVVKTLPGVGHMPFFSKPDICCTWIETFVEEEVCQRRVTYD